MKTQQRKLSQGFTIIEVLIVLAIAGLILAIVFLAVPALQRNTRNNGRVNDAARVGAAVNNWVSNNNGGTPTQAGSAATIVTDVGASSLSQYTGIAAQTCNQGDTTSDFCIVTAATAGTGKITTTYDLRLVTGAICDSANQGQVTTTGASTKSLALQYGTEGGGTTTNSVCLNI